MRKLLSSARFLIVEWRLIAWRARLHSDPWAGFALFLISSSLVANALIFWFVAHTYFSLLRRHDLDPAHYGTPLLILGILWAFAATRIRYGHELSHFWIIKAAPLPRGLKNLDRALSLYLSLAALGAPPLFITLPLAGYPALSAVNLLLATALFGLILWPFALPDYFLDILVGYTMGWLNGFLLQEILKNGAYLTFASEAERLDLLWKLFEPFAFPMPKILEEVFRATPQVQLALTLILILATLIALSHLPQKTEPHALALRLWEQVSHRAGPRAVVLEHLFAESETALRRMAGWAGVALGLRHYLGWKLPLYPALWILVLLFWSPVLAKEAPLPRTLLANATRAELAMLRARLLRAKLEWICMATLVVLIWNARPRVLAAVLAWIAGFWTVARSLTRLPPIAIASMLTLGGALLLWFLAGK